MHILIDIGNSRLKWGLIESNSFIFKDAYDYRILDVLITLQLVWQNFPTPNSLLIASVAQPDLVNDITRLAVQIWSNIKIIQPKVTLKAFGVSNGYLQPGKLGIDRWLALLAAHHFYPGRICIVDCGTAITLDLLEITGNHLGGLISPGLSTMKKSLIEQTARLCYEPELKPFGLAQTTSSAIENGVLYSAIGLIESFSKRLEQPCQLLLCGGDAKIIAAKLDTSVIIDDDLIFKGLGLFIENN